MDNAAGGAFTIVLPSQNKALGVAAGRLVLADPAGAGAFTFEPAQGCAVYPEVETSATGTPFTSRTPWGEVKGMIDLHLHAMAFEFLGGKAHCGKPWSPYGAPYALVDCPDHQVGNGCGAVLENALYGNPARCHDPVGWPTFKDWPNHDSLTHEQTYYKWIERAYMGGLRVMVNLFVENRQLCELYPFKQNDCDEMASVRLQNKDIDALQDYIDAQNGGPGRGWFRIVTNPFQARRVIASGKLARDQGNRGVGAVRLPGLQRRTRSATAPRSTARSTDVTAHGRAPDGADQQVRQRARRRGRRQRRDRRRGERRQPARHRQVLADAALHGPAGGARQAAARRVRPRRERHPRHVIEQFLPLGVAPVYPNDSNCNARGLTDLGDHAVRKLMQDRIIIDPDHLSVKARKSMMDLIEAARYSGAVSSHSWSTADVIPRIYKVGGVVTPMQESAPRWIKNWKETKAQRDRRFYFGFGYGADQNGLASQLEPRDGGSSTRSSRSTAGSHSSASGAASGCSTSRRTASPTTACSRTGGRTSGPAPAGGRSIRDMARGAEAYLQEWERVYGIRHGCKSRLKRITRRGVAHVRLRNSAAQLLRRAGQPKARGNYGWRWCVRGKKNRHRKLAAALTRRGKVALVATNAVNADARRIRVGDDASRLSGQARSLGGGLFVRGAGPGKRFVYGVRGGRVRFVGLATRAASKNRAALRRYVRLAKLR